MSEKNFFNETVDEVAKKLKTDKNNGLSEKDIQSRILEHGYNELKTGKKKSLFIKFLEQFKDFMIIILLIAAVVSRNYWNV